MKYGFASFPQAILAALIFCLPASVGWARGDASAAVGIREPEISAPAPELADQIDALLTGRFAALDAVGSLDARRRGLENLSQFANLTIEGLIEASPSGEIRALMDAGLRPILTHHQRKIADALAALDARPAPNAYRSSAADLSSLARVP